MERLSTAKVTSKGQITIPKAVREKLNLRPGDKVRFEIEDDGAARMRAMNRSLDDIIGMLKPYTDGHRDRRRDDRGHRGSCGGKDRTGPRDFAAAEDAACDDFDRTLTRISWSDLAVADEPDAIARANRRKPFIRDAAVSADIPLLDQLLSFFANSFGC